MDLASIQAAGEGLSLLPEAKDYPDMVRGRVAHIDADFLAYYASYEREGEDRKLDEMILGLQTMITDIRKQCGAETAVLHTTPNGSDKAGRHAVAVQKAYQSSRQSEKPRLLEVVRAWMEVPMMVNVTGRSWLDAEADDGMAEAAWEAYADGQSDLCVVASRDKDLRMVPGLHLNFDTGELEGADDTFGFIKVKTTVKKKEGGKTSKTHKPRGYGTKFFWWQMLMGDSADTIPGIPRCGIIKAADLLAGAGTDYEALNIVKAAYKEYGQEKGFVHWDTKDDVPWAQAFMASAQLLWMQRTAGQLDDVKDWMREIISEQKRSK